MKAHTKYVGVRNDVVIGENKAFFADVHSGSQSFLGVALAASAGVTKKLMKRFPAPKAISKSFGG